VNVSALLPGFTAHEQLSTKAVLAENIVAFLQAQKEPEAGQPEQQDAEQQDADRQDEAPRIGSPAWTAELIRQIRKEVIPIPARTAAVAPALREWSDTDSEVAGFSSVLESWYDDEFDGDEADLLPQLQLEKLRISTEEFKNNCITDEQAVADCKRQLPTFLHRNGTTPQGWSARKVLKLWIRAVNKKILEVSALVKRRARQRSAQRRQETVDAETGKKPTVDELPESRRPRKSYGETAHDRFSFFLEQCEHRSGCFWSAASY
jgi:hypothetical protein